MSTHNQLLCERVALRYTDSCSSLVDRTSLSRTVSAKFELSLSHSNSITSGGKVLTISLTSEVEPVFFYYSRISEADFRRIRAEQNLVISFDLFPSALINLINISAACSLDIEPRVQLHLFCQNVDQGSRAAFNVIELNNFRHVVHLQLYFNAASDKDTIKMLAASLTALQSHYDHIQTIYRNTNDRMNAELCSSKEQLVAERDYHRRLREDWGRRLHDLEQSFASRLGSEQAKLSEVEHQSAIAIEDCKRKFRLESGQKAKEFRQKVRRIESELEAAADELRSVSTEKDCLDERVRELSSELHGLRKEVASVIEQKALVAERLEMTSGQLQEMQSRLEEGESAMDELKRNCSEMVQERDAALHSARLESDGIRKDLADAEDTVRTLRLDLTRANEIIETLMGEVERRADKIKTDETAVAQLQKDHQLAETRLEHSLKQNADLRTVIDHLKQEKAHVLVDRSNQRHVGAGPRRFVGRIENRNDQNYSRISSIK